MARRERRNVGDPFPRGFIQMSKDMAGVHLRWDARALRARRPRAGCTPFEASWIPPLAQGLLTDKYLKGLLRRLIRRMAERVQQIARRRGVRRLRGDRFD
jgi:hypothetical protein